mgnify:CR=1 FL=1
MFEIIIVVVRWCRHFNETGIVIENRDGSDTMEMIDSLFAFNRWNRDYIKYISVFTTDIADEMTELEVKKLKSLCVNGPFAPRNSIVGKTFDRFTCKSVDKVNDDKSGRYDSLAFS